MQACQVGLDQAVMENWWHRARGPEQECLLSLGGRRAVTCRQGSMGVQWGHSGGSREQMPSKGAQEESSFHPFFSSQRSTLDAWGCIPLPTYWSLTTMGTVQGHAGGGTVLGLSSACC